MPQALIELGGAKNAPLMSLAPANGFVPQTYIPLLRPFMAAYHVVSTPPKALWGDGAPPEITLDYTWYDLSVDMIAAYEQFGLKDVIAIGHSIGGVMSILAAIQRPDLFKALILLDPVLVDHSILEWVRGERRAGRTPAFPLAELAMRRRREFESIEAAFQNFHGRSIFKDWSDEVLQLYVEHGTYECDTQRCLTWSPDWEAFYYSTYYPDIWDDLPKLNDLDIPILVIAAEHSDTFFPKSAQLVQEILPYASVMTINDHGHLFPQSAPQKAAHMIATWLTENLG